MVSRPAIALLYALGAAVPASYVSPCCWIRCIPSSVLVTSTSLEVLLTSFSSSSSLSITMGVSLTVPVLLRFRPRGCAASLGRLSWGRSSSAALLACSCPSPSLALWPGQQTEGVRQLHVPGPRL